MDKAINTIAFIFTLFLWCIPISIIIYMIDLIEDVSWINIKPIHIGQIVIYNIIIIATLIVVKRVKSIDRRRCTLEKK